MTSKIKVDTILPRSSNTLTLGDSNTTVALTGTIDGSDLSNMNASNLASGTVPAARLPADVVLATEAPTYSSISPTLAVPSTATDITITGTNFVSVPTVELISSTGAILQATTVSYSSSTSLVASVSVPASNYFIRVENNNGQAVRSTNADLTVSAAPSFTTAAGSLGSFAKGATISVNVSGTSDSAITITKTSGTFPTGLSIGSTVSNTATISGTESGTQTSATTYNFTLTATDAESQTATRDFSITISPVTINKAMVFT